MVSRKVIKTIKGRHFDFLNIKTFFFFLEKHRAKLDGRQLTTCLAKHLPEY